MLRILETTCYDDLRGILYISDGANLDRFQLSTRTFLAPLTIGGRLSGMDISPDGSHLVVADTTLFDQQPCIHIVDLADLTVQSPCFQPSFYEGGSFTAAYASDGSILVTTQFQGSGWVPLRQFVPSTGMTTVLAQQITQNSMLRANADHSVIAIAESNISDGRFGNYVVATGTLTLESGYTNGTSAYNYEIAVSPDAQQYAIPTYSGTILADANLAKLSTIVGSGLGQPVGVAYNPVNNSVYFPWAGTSLVYVYDRTTLTQTAYHLLSGTFGNNGNYAFVNGRVKTSNDGKLLFVTVTGGVRYLTLDVPAPSGVKVVPGYSSVNLNWAPVPNAVSYNVYQGTLPGYEGVTPVATGITGTTTSISALTDGTTYYFTVAAVTPAGTSTPSDEVSATPYGAPPGSIVWQNTDGSVALWFTAGGTVASSANLGTVASGWSLAGKGDFKGDGSTDLLWRSANGDTVIWFMNGATIASTVDLGVIPQAWTIKATGDFNGDGKTDILWRKTDGDVVIWYMSGGGVASSSDFGVIPNHWTIQGIGHFNGAGPADILWRNAKGDVVMWEMNGSTVFPTADLGAIPLSWTIQGTGDFNGDGKSDILWRNTNGDVVAWFMNGAAIASSADLGVIPSSWTIQGTGDYNGDGRTDILWRNSNGDVVTWLMNGATISSSFDLGVIPPTWTVVPGH